jgi:hypothetical protein
MTVPWGSEFVRDLRLRSSGGQFGSIAGSQHAEVQPQILPLRFAQRQDDKLGIGTRMAILVRCEWWANRAHCFEFLELERVNVPRGDLSRQAAKA